MSKSLFFFLLGLAHMYTGQSQIVANIKGTGDLTVEPGLSNTYTITVKNTQKVAIVKYKSDYLVTMVYKGSGNVGRQLNVEADLGAPLDPGASRTLRMNYTGPTLPGEYPVDLALKWGGKIVSNVERVVFVVKPEYKTKITARAATFSISRGGTPDIDLYFYVKNTGYTAWPEGRYSLEFDVVSTPSGASRYDQEAFGISPKNLEYWDLEPGVEETYVFEDFKPPYASGNYVVRVTLLLDGKPFEADGNPQNLTFKFNVK